MNLERVLDGPNVGYCSDSDDEQDLAASGPPGASQTQKSPYDGPQTGPKGVLADYDNYNRDLDLKEIESELKVISSYPQLYYSTSFISG
jgi:hypothetical protein